MTKNAVARDEAISLFYRWQKAKREIAALRSPRLVIARNVALSVFYQWRTAKERLLRRLAMTKNAVARNEAISPEFCHREERSDLAFLPMATAKREIAALRSQ